jgi:branched-subunit amino acid permease
MKTFFYLVYCSLFFILLWNVKKVVQLVQLVLRPVIVTDFLHRVVVQPSAAQCTRMWGGRS